MMPKTYDPKPFEAQIGEFWRVHQVGKFSPTGPGEIFSIDTPPPTASGFLHMGHVYSYSHTDFLARFWRMQGKRVFYPMGFDDNGLPTERFVEKRRGVKMENIGLSAFIQQCNQVSQEVEQEYQDLWQKMGLSIDWDYSYRTIDDRSRRIAQWSFLDLYQKSLVYRQEAPAIWCPECQASFAQADLNDLERETEMITLPFMSHEGELLPVATTRPELLAACVAVFIHPNDHRLQVWKGRRVMVPFYNQEVPVLTDSHADPTKGSGAVMCCTFGDFTDVFWWRAYNLPFVKLVMENGSLSESAGPLAGMHLENARHEIKQLLNAQNMILDRHPVVQSIRVHERCDTPVEYLLVKQWFIRILEHKKELIDLGEQIHWFPAHMKMRYRSWVENLNWDWCISRQRFFGVPFPVWYCDVCGAVTVADEAELPVDPREQTPQKACAQCGGRSFHPETDIFDTWATSSMSPQIVGGWRDQPELYEQVFPFAMRAQAHEIIRTWAFYTIVKSYYHFGAIPWKNIAISGWGIAGEGMGKISKSRGGGEFSPQGLLSRYSADALRYWAASTGPGKDAVISEEKIQNGTRLVTKMWNVARFASRFFQEAPSQADSFSPADVWIMARLQEVIQKMTQAFHNYDYAEAKNEVESFFWHDLADNYLEMAKQRLYDPAESLHSGAVCTLRECFFTVIKLFAPILPYITEQIFQELFATQGTVTSIHSYPWPQIQSAWVNQNAVRFGETLVDIATSVRRFKSQRNLPLGSELSKVQLAVVDESLLEMLVQSASDLRSVTRTKKLEFVQTLGKNQVTLDTGTGIQVGIDYIEYS